MIRRVVTAALLALLLLPAGAHAASVSDVLRDCEDDSRLEGTYTRAELTAALSAVPTDVDQYGDCRDVISRARLDLAGAAATGARGRDRDGGAPAGGTRPGGSGPSATLPEALRSGGAGTASRALEGATPAERESVARATRESGDRSLRIGGADVRPDVSASTTMPLPLLVLLVLLAGSVATTALARLRSRLTRGAEG